MNDFLKKRRNRLLNEIGDALLILPASSEKVRNNDVFFPFRQDSDFHYLTNFNEPEAILILDGKNKTQILISKEDDPNYAIWEGVIIGQERAKKEYGFDEAYPLSEKERIVKEKLLENDSLIIPFSRYNEFDNFILHIIREISNTRHKNPPKKITSSDLYIHKMRLYKDRHEIACMLKASEISSNAHKNAMAFCKPGKYEYDIAAYFDFCFKRNNSSWAYDHIIAGGNNACTLHYRDNKDILKEGDLLLIDAGCEYKGYAADITRTFPISGNFTNIQKNMYSWVLKAQEAAILECKPGNNIKSPHNAAYDVLIDAMETLGLYKKTNNDENNKEKIRTYFMHGTSHWLGIDVHDVGDYEDKDKNPTVFEPGMVITVEPGLYVREDDKNAPEALRGIGIRIEDNILITDSGHENLTKDCPKTIDEIEEACNSSATF